MVRKIIKRVADLNPNHLRPEDVIAPLTWLAQSKCDLGINQISNHSNYSRKRSSAVLRRKFTQLSLNNCSENLAEVIYQDEFSDF